MFFFKINSDDLSQKIQRSGYVAHYELSFVISFSLLLFFTGVTAGLLIGKLLIDKEDDVDKCQGNYASSANWGGTVTQGGVEEPVLEAIVDMMNADNIKENLK